MAACEILPTTNGLTGDATHLCCGGGDVARVVGVGVVGAGLVVTDDAAGVVAAGVDVSLVGAREELDVHVGTAVAMLADDAAHVLRSCDGALVDAVGEGAHACDVAVTEDAGHVVGALERDVGLAGEVGEREVLAAEVADEGCLVVIGRCCECAREGEVLDDEAAAGAEEERCTEIADGVAAAVERTGVIVCGLGVALADACPALAVHVDVGRQEGAGAVLAAFYDGLKLQQVGCRGNLIDAVHLGERPHTCSREPKDGRQKHGSNLLFHTYRV